MTIQIDRRLAIGLMAALALAAGGLLRAWMARNESPPLVDTPTQAPSAVALGGAPTVASGPAKGDLAAYCRDVSASSDSLLGRVKLQQLEANVATLMSQASAGNDVEVLRQLTQTRFMFGVELLNQGEFSRAIDEYDETLRLAAATGASQEGYDQLLLRRGVAHMRTGAVENCVRSLTTFGCIIMTGEAGAFSRTEHTAAAIRDLEAVLADYPSHTSSQWLLNLAYMELGRYPDDVPAPWLIPPVAFASTRDAPSFVNLAPALDLDEVNLAGGSIMEDFDGDGRLDIFTTTYDPCDHVLFYRNVGDGRLVEESTAAGLEDQLGGFNAQQTDFDNDGDMDVFITRGAWEEDSGRQRNSLLANDGSAHFTDVTAAAGLAQPAYPSQTSAWADYDGDGFLDLFVGNEGTKSIPGYPSQLFHNNGDGTFTDVAAAAGVTNERFAKGVAWGDYDNDGYPDLYVSNLGANRLYHNNGDGTFTDVAGDLGVAAPVGRSLSLWFWDYNNDGWLDIYVAAYDATVANVALGYMGEETTGGRPRLYRNDGQGGFDDVTAAAGLDRVLMPMGANYGDIDNDGWLDFYLGTGDPEYTSVMPNVLYWNNGGEGFIDVTAAAGVGHLGKGHGVAFGDIDNDGDQDLFQQLGGFARGDAEPNTLYENQGTDNNWIALQLVGVRANRPAIGARIRIEVQTGSSVREIHAEVTSGGSFGASSIQQEIGLGQADRIRAIEVRWPGSGTVQHFEDVGVNQFLEITEGQAAPSPLTRPVLRLGASARN